MNKDKPEKEKKPLTEQQRRNRKTLVIALVLLVAATGLAFVLGVFEGFGSIMTMLVEWKDILLKLVIMAAFVALVSNLILLLLQNIHGKRGRVKTLATVISSLVRYAAVFLGICWGLYIIGVDLSTIFASVGIVALILGFGAESLVADLVTGVFILFENQYNVGDIIEVDGFRGTVREIGIRTISVMDTGGNVKIINNSDLKNIVNRSDCQSVAVCDVGVSYGTDIEDLEKKLEKILPEIQKKHPDIFTGNIRYVGVEELGDSSVVIRVVADVREENIFSGRRLLNRELKIAFDKEHIEIPFPQLDMHSK